MTHNKDKPKPFRWLDYGSITGEPHWEACPTCQGSGRISRSDEAQLMAVIPCSDQRLKPSRTKLYVCISIALCLLICSLFLFFLFPRSLVMSPVTLQSSFIYFTPQTVQMIITNKLNISNQNFVSTEAHDLDLQALINEIVVGRTKMSNVTTVPPRSQKTFTVVTNVIIEDLGLVYYCQTSAFRPHTLYVQLQMTIKANYLSHEEQLSVDTFEYVDCGRNTTIPHNFP
ncbi:transmembrane protein 106A [Ictalurus punctatus]|uniref:Transmembrane protein 106A n=1 Tax=Ictalurus punctatus TaxID=7998 RepID=A0A2D0S9Y7_ICTPU|nr:transmembrane protein 106A [Ictalurus punctatus]XP_017339548.1 transmembrane protein 106A [Ictalurus punctatus]